MSDLSLMPPPVDYALRQRRLEACEHVGRTILRALSFAGITLFFLISPELLEQWGIRYGDTGGSVLEKVHPGTWLVLTALVLMGLGRGNPIRILDDFIRSRAVAMYLFAWVILVGFTIRIQNTPFTPLIDTFLLPALLYVLIGNMKVLDKKRAAIIVHILLNANALLALYEYSSGYRQTTSVGGVVAEGDWRATALLGHPLANALITGCYVLIIAVGGGRELPKLLRPLVMGVQLLAMVAFGGRSALVITLLLLGCFGLKALVRILIGGRVDILQIGLLFMAVPIVMVAFAHAADVGFFDQLLQRFVDDNGSADSRIIMLRLFSHIPWEALIFGPDPELIGNLQNAEGIAVGIESFWIAFILMNGLAISAVFFLAMAGFSWKLVTATRSATTICWSISTQSYRRRSACRRRPANLAFLSSWS